MEIRGTEKERDWQNTAALNILARWHFRFESSRTFSPERRERTDTTRVFSCRDRSALSTLNEDPKSDAMRGGRVGDFQLCRRPRSSIRQSTFAHGRNELRPARRIVSEFNDRPR